jgi:hypothetical protein
MASIFDRIRLTPGQLRTVAERRFADAEALRRTGRNERANGVMYLAGFVVECLLKARLLEAFPALQAGPLPSGMDRLWFLCYRSHDLEGIVEQLPGLGAALEHQKAGAAEMLSRVCAEWTIYARYSPRSATMREAAEFVERVRELKRCLR